MSASVPPPTGLPKLIWQAGSLTLIVEPVTVAAAVLLPQSLGLERIDCLKVETRALSGSPALGGEPMAEQLVQPLALRYWSSACAACVIAAVMPPPPPPAGT